MSRAKSKLQATTAEDAQRDLGCNEETADALVELQRRTHEARRRYAWVQPKRIADVVADVVQRRGYARQRAAAACEDAWQAAVGTERAQFTRPGAVRRGVLEVTVAHSLLMQELGFDKQRLVATLRAALPDMNIREIRFRIGSIQ
jgi:predicted nucleic acid-binding Zn ribbon protein